MSEPPWCDTSPIAIDDRFTQIGGNISNQYFVNQGNFQFSTGYTYRF